MSCLKKGRNALPDSGNTRKAELASAIASDKPMKFDSQVLLAQLAVLMGSDVPSRWLVAYSGGIDSTVLLHALVACRHELQQKILAVHIDHGLHNDSPQWTEHCRRTAGELKVDFLSHKVEVPVNSGTSTEAAAREARYAALAALMLDGDCVLSAHHEDDQAETLLLNLTRGCGLAGIAGIGARQPFSRGYLLRPLLDVSGQAILAYAKQNKLDWIQDPSNTDTRFARNYLRREVMPLLASRWPAVATKFKLSADLASEGSQLLNELADLDLAVHEGPGRLSIPEFRTLSLARQRNALRRAVQLCGLPPAPASSIAQALHGLIPAREDAQPLVRWQGAELRRYRNQLFVLPERTARMTAANAVLLPDGNLLELGNGMGALELAASADTGIAPALVAQGLQLRYRQGGEEIRLAGHNITHKLKNLLQQEGILPWMRDRLPLLYADNELVAVADLWVAAGCAAQQGLIVNWQRRPAIR
jgi:tRNA(Ile)-lysidine synthase